MAEVDEITRKRELRRRKILENAETRLKKITGEHDYSPNKNEHHSCDTGRGEDDHKSGISGIDSESSSANANRTAIKDADVLQNSIPFNSSYSSGESFDMSTGDSSSPSSSANGLFSRSSFDESYTFPKKVSDAETRSFGRTRADSRRNSSCTQLMMERLHYSYFRLSVLRPWIVIMTGLLASLSFAMGYLSDVLENIFLPFVMLELALHIWMKLDPQVSSRQTQPSLISGALMLSGVSPSVILSLTNRLKSVQHLLQDLAIYIFSFVVIYFLSEKYFS